MAALNATWSRCSGGLVKVRISTDMKVSWIQNSLLVGGGEKDIAKEFYSMAFLLGWACECI